VLALIRKKNFGVNLYLVGSRKMRALHWKYFKDRSDTDCISFSQFERHSRGQAKILGDVFVSWDQVKKQAPQYNNSSRSELLYCVIHGLLHLLGHDDHDPAMKRTMFKLQDKIHQKLSSRYL